MSKLLVLEGLDGAGTTTQARRLRDALVERGHAVHTTREPSDGPIGRMIREMLNGGHALPGGAAIEQANFSLLFAADRLDHLQREIGPALADGKVVISDRYDHSSLAYQGTGAERDWITTLNRRARRPDLTIFLRVRAETGAERRLAAGRSQDLFEDLVMQRKVAAGYDDVMAACTAAGEPVVILDGEQPLDDVTRAIVAAAEQVLGS